MLFATWFTYDVDGSPLWLVIDKAVKTGPGVYSGNISLTQGARFDAYDPTRFAATTVGSATFAFTDANNGVFTYSVNGVTQSKPITRFVFAKPATTCYFPP